MNIDSTAALGLMGVQKGMQGMRESAASLASAGQAAATRTEFGNRGVPSNSTRCRWKSPPKSSTRPTRPLAHCSTYSLKQALINLISVDPAKAGIHTIQRTGFRPWPE